MSTGYMKRVDERAAADIEDLPPISLVSARDFTPEMHEARAREMEALYRDEDYPRSMAEIGIIYGMTRERVRQIFDEYGIERRTHQEARESRFARWDRHGKDVERS
jgi:protein-disulfide isomerase-like protein with CxxC motif